MAKLWSKSEGTNSEGEQGAVGFRNKRERDWGVGNAVPIRLWGLEVGERFYVGLI